MPRAEDIGEPPSMAASRHSPTPVQATRRFVSSGHGGQRRRSLAWQSVIRVHIWTCRSPELSRSGPIDQAAAMRGHGAISSESEALGSRSQQVLHQRRASFMRPPLRIGTVYDFRNTPESGMDMPSLYAAIMDQVVMLDGLGLDLVWFTEHHFLEDGYLPSWVPIGGRDRRAYQTCAAIERRLPAAVQSPGAAGRGSRSTRQYQ